MACTNCSTDKSGLPKGCKNNGTCGTDSCNKLTVFNWLSNMEPPLGYSVFPYVEVRFKNSRKEYFRYDPDNLSLHVGDMVATQAQSGHDIGMVTLVGELVSVQMQKKNISTSASNSQKIYRKASQKDLNTWQNLREKEEAIRVEAQKIALELNLVMKISDVEYQGDGSKLVFYYTAEDRVDFRELIRHYASSFKTRIEMKQIGLRQEAARLGGIGSCGRELCCSTWLTDFRSVNTSAARYQQLALNPQKLAGQCGKLKCCLNYELDTYLDALKDFPETGTKIQTKKGEAVCQKIDIFKEKLWFGYLENGSEWVELSKDTVNEILSGKIQPDSLESLKMDITPELSISSKTPEFDSSLTRFDKPKTRNNQRRKRNKNQTQSGSNPNRNKGDRNKRPRKRPNNPNKS